MPIFTSRHSTATFKDTTGTPITKTLGPGPMDLSIQGFEEGGKEGIAIYDNGTFLEMVYGKDKEFPFSLTVYHDGDQTGTSVLDAILKEGNFASGTTADPGGVVWTGILYVSMVRGAVTNTFTLTGCRFKADWAAKQDGNTYAITGTCYGGITRT